MAPARPKVERASPIAKASEARKTLNHEFVIQERERAATASGMMQVEREVIGQTQVPARPPKSGNQALAGARPPRIVRRRIDWRELIFASSDRRAHGTCPHRARANRSGSRPRIFCSPKVEEFLNEQAMVNRVLPEAAPQSFFVRLLLLEPYLYLSLGERRREHSSPG